MASWKQKTWSLYRKSFSGVYEKVSLKKRNDNQQQGTVRNVTIFRARHGNQVKTKNTIQGDMSADHRTTWFLPRLELKRAGVSYINPTDRIVDEANLTWRKMVTSTLSIT